jgi:RNA-directed DNA polymerase
MTLIEELAGEFSLGASHVRQIVDSAPRRYKVYQIPKRHGGFRTIAQPSRELKAIQRYIIASKLTKLQVHAAATAYVVKKNILQNAQIHQESRVILKLDFTDFFPSVLTRDWTRYVREELNAEFLRRDVGVFAKILFWGRGTNTPTCLSIGAPSSPILSNILMYRLDCQFDALAQEYNVKYSRYADDITISGQSIEDVTSFETAARNIIKDTRSPKLRFNDGKRGLYLRGQRRMITGLILTPSGQISIGRERKRLISAMAHHVLMGTATDEERARLKGLLGFSIGTEPAFVSRLRQKYGNAVIDGVLEYHVPGFVPLQQ